MRGIVVVHGAIVLSTHGYDVEHVVVIILRVDTIHNKRLIACGVGLGESVGMGHRLLKVLFACCLGIIKGKGVVGVDRAKHRLIDGGKHIVATIHGLLLHQLHALYNRLERVGRQFTLIVSRLDLSLEQLAIGTLTLGLVGYLREKPQHSLRMILPYCHVVLLPKRRVGVGYCCQWQEQRHGY